MTPSREKEDKEGFYEKLWKDFVSLQRGDVNEICIEAEKGRQYKAALERAIETLNKYADESNWETIHVCDSYSGAVGDLFRLGLKDDSDTEGPQYSKKVLEEIYALCPEMKK